MSTPVRQLAAIMFTDIVGYSALMNRDEDRAYAILRKNRELHKRVISEYNGRFLKEMGDGILASFNSTTDAARCAIAIQDSAQELAPLSLRIGIHLGEVIFEEEDVFGDGVNIASRIEAAARPGSIYASEAIVRTLTSRSDFSTRFVSSEKLKNVEGPVKLYSIGKSASEGVEAPSKNWKVLRLSAVVFLLIIVLGAAYGLFLKSNASEIQASLIANKEKSIAILPFKNLSADETNRFFADGIMSAIHSHLSRIDGLKLTSTTSTEKFRNSDLTSSEIGDELDVSFLVAGQVQKIGNDYLVTVNLTDAESDVNLWSDQMQFELTIDQLLEAQSSIARQMIDRMSIKLSNQEIEQITSIPTNNLQAYEFYQRGKYHSEQVQDRFNNRVISTDYFKKAIALDNEFAAAYAGLADSYAIMGYFSMDTIYVDSARQAVARALAIDPDLPEALTTYGYILKSFDWEFEKARAQFLKSLKINRNNSTTLLYYSLLLASTNDLDSALSVARTSISIDPLNPMMHENYIRILGFNGQIQEAWDYHQANEGSLGVPRALSQMKMELGDTLGGLKEFATMIDTISEIPQDLRKDLAVAVEESDVDTGLALLAEILVDVPQVYIAIGRYDKAFEILEASFNQRDATLTYLLVDSGFDPVRKDPRFEELIKKIGLERYQSE